MVRVGREVVQPRAALAAHHVAQRFPQVLDQRRRHVDPEPVDAPAAPEPQDVGELRAHPRIAPVQVGLLGREQVQVPLPVRHPGPGGPAEARLPVARRAARRPPGAEDVALPLRGARPGRQRTPEPLVLVRGVVRDHVEQDAEPAGVRGGEHPVEVGQGAQRRVDGAVVGDVVARVEPRRPVAGGQPERVHAEVDEVVQPGRQAGEVAEAVAVGVGEAARQDLVDDRVPPPRGWHGSPPRRCVRCNHRMTRDRRDGSPVPGRGRRARRCRATAFAFHLDVSPDQATEKQVRTGVRFEIMDA